MKDVDHLLQRRRRGIDHVIAEDHGKRLGAYQVARDEHGVAEPEGLALAHVGKVDEIRNLANLRQELRLAARLEKGLELDRDVEVILDRVLSPPGHEDDVRHAGGHGFLDAVLNDRLVDQRQHLFGLRFGGRKKASTQTCSGEDGFANRVSHGWTPIQRGIQAS